jgi:hypothetical protein
MNAVLHSPPATTSDVAAENLSWLFLLLRAATEFTNKYIIGVVIILGIGGNILSIIVFWRCRRKDQVTVTYLAPLAVADLATLIYGAFSWVVTGILGNTNGYFFFSGSAFSFGPQVVCKVFRYQHRVSSCISSYLIVMFSLERCLGVWFPMKIHILMTRRRRRTFIGLMVVAMLLSNTPILVYFRVHYWGGTTNTGCFFDVPELTKIETYFLIEFNDIIVPHLLPCLLILVLNILIIAGVWSARKEVSGKSVMTKHDNTLNNLLFISLLYLITTLPFVIVWGICDYFNYIADGFIAFTPDEVQVMLMLGFFTTSFAMLNYCFNFLIYASSLKIFRDELSLCTGQIRLWNQMRCHIGKE